MKNINNLLCEETQKLLLEHFNRFHQSISPRWSVWPDINHQIVYESYPKMISLGKWMIFTPLHELPNNVSDLGKMIAATGFEWLPKVQKIAQSGHTANDTI